MKPARIDILTLFPEAVDGFLGASILGGARRDGLIDVRAIDIRAFSSDKHRSVDDAPYGGGDGMVLRPEPVVAAIEASLADAANTGRKHPRVVLLTPRGRRFDRARAAEFAESLQQEGVLVLVAGRYAGFDERIAASTGAEELSIGDYVLSGGELPALVVAEAVTRRLPGVLGNPLSSELDSFEDGLLEHPVYTRPPEFRGRPVPDVLLSGDHAAIERARRRGALEATLLRRPDLLETALAEGRLSGPDLEILNNIRADIRAQATERADTSPRSHPEQSKAPKSKEPK